VAIILIILKSLKHQKSGVRRWTTITM